MSRKTYDATLKTGKKLNFGPNLGPPKSFSWVLPLLKVRQCSKLSPYAMSKKTNEPNLKKATKTLFWARFWQFFAQIWTPIFLLQVLPLLVVRHGSKLSFYAIYRKTNKPNLEKWQKNLILGLILVHFGPNLVPQFFFRGFTSTGCYTLLQAIIVCNFKEN